MKAFLLIAVLFSASLFAQVSQVRDGKIYLKPSEIEINQKGLFAFIENQWVQISQIQADASGAYVLKEQFFPWQCDRCGRVTTGWWACEYCGNPK